MYGIKYQMLFVDDEPSKPLQNSKCSGFFTKFLKKHKFSKNKVQWLDLASHLWPTFVGLPLATIIGVHCEIIVKYSKSFLISSPNCSWCMQYMKNDNGESDITQFPLSINSFYT